MSLLWFSLRRRRQQLTKGRGNDMSKRKQRTTPIAIRVRPRTAARIRNKHTVAAMNTKRKEDKYASFSNNNAAAATLTFMLVQVIITYLTRRDSDFMKYPRKVRPGNLNTILQIELIWIICRCAFARTKATVPPSPHKYIFEKPKVWSLCKGGQSVFPQSKLVGHGGIEVVCGMCGEWRTNIPWQEETNPKKGYSTVQVCKESDATTCQMSHSHLPQMSEDV